MWFSAGNSAFLVSLGRLVKPAVWRVIGGSAISDPQFSSYRLQKNCLFHGTASEDGSRATKQLYRSTPSGRHAQLRKFSVGPNRSRDSQLGLLLCLGGAEGPSASCGGGWPSHRGHALIDDDWCRFCF